MAKATLGVSRVLKLDCHVQMSHVSEQTCEEPALALPRRNPSAIFRSDDREVAATYRMTRAEKESIRREAAELGLSGQQLFELRMFGQAKPVGRDGRPPKPKRSQMEELPIAG